MVNSFGSLCDEFFVELLVNTELDLPGERDTVLNFFERIEKQFPTLSYFHRRDNGEFCLEEDREGDKYRWVSMEVDRIAAGCANPGELEDAYGLQRAVLELAPYMLGVSHLDVESLDVTFTMDFDYQGNHDEIVAEALFGTSAFSSLLDMSGARPLSFSPTAIVSLGDDCYTQARVAVEPRTTVYEVRSRKYKPDEPISLYLTVRRYQRPGEKLNMLKSFREQCRLAEDLMVGRIIPNFANPLINAIAQRR